MPYKTQVDTTATWYPNLNGLNLPSQLTQGIQQSFSLTYGLRDSVSQISNAVNRMIEYGTRNARNALAATAVPDGALYFESDRATVFYQARLSPRSNSPRWFYAGGIMFDTSTNRPTDLGQDDVGFLFLASDTTQMSRWDGAAWVAV
jgi:hypothetical protein